MLKHLDLWELCSLFLIKYTYTMSCPAIDEVMHPKLQVGSCKTHTNTWNYNHIFIKYHSQHFKQKKHNYNT